jgi:uncharacterized protein YecE (DUF72 family)
VNQQSETFRLVKRIAMKAPNGFKPGYYSGLSGLQLPVPKYLYPPDFENASRLTYYSSLFNSIEINSSFYKIPKVVTASKWAASVFPGFKFTFKLWKEISHSKDLQFKKEDVATFFKSINSIEEKTGCLLLQFPPGLDRICVDQLHNLLHYIKQIDKIPSWKIAVEFRNNSWYQQPVYDLLDSYKASVVIHDIPKSATPVINHTADFIYIRFHGPTGNYRDSYSEDFLHEYAIYIREWMEEGRTVYVYFNNTAGDAFNNLKQLNSFVHENA